MKQFKVYYKECFGDGVKSMMVSEVTGTNVVGPDGEWNPKDSVYFTRAQANRHRCRCVSCRAMKGQNPMSIRFTTLPCNLKIRLNEGMLELRGDWGVPEDQTDFAKDVTVRRVKMLIDDSSTNLETIAAFFTKEAEKRRRREEDDE